MDDEFNQFSKNQQEGGYNPPSFWSLVGLAFHTYCKTIALFVGVVLLLSVTMGTIAGIFYNLAFVAAFGWPVISILQSIGIFVCTGLFWGFIKMVGHA